MTHHATTHPSEAGHAGGPSTALPFIGSAILALIWGAYTIVVLYEIVVVSAG